MITTHRSFKKYRTCQRKTPLTLKAASSIIKKELKKGKHLTAYLCPHCKMWHLTSKLK